MKVLYKDKLGNKIVEREEGIGLQNKEGVFTIEKDFKDFVKEHKLTEDIKFFVIINVIIPNNKLSTPPIKKC